MDPKQEAGLALAAPLGLGGCRGFGWQRRGEAEGRPGAAGDPARLPLGRPAPVSEGKERGWASPPATAAAAQTLCILLVS